MLESEKTPEVEQPRFDTRTHVRDPKSGRVTRLQLYSLKVMQGPGGEGIRLFERPVKSGIFHFANGLLAEEYSRDGLMRLQKEKDEKAKTDFERKQDAFERAKSELEVSRKAYDADQKVKQSATKEVR